MLIWSKNLWHLLKRLNERVFCYGRQESYEQGAEGEI